VTSTPPHDTPGTSRSGRPPKVAVADIIDIALEMFGTRGLRGTSIGAVAERAGLTDSGVLHYFPNKEALIDAVVERAVEEQTSQMRALVAPGGLDAIKRMAAWGEIVQDTPELVALQVILSSEAILEDSSVAPHVVRRYAAIHDLAAGLIREGIARGEIRPDVDADWEASATVAYLDGIRLQWFYSGRQLPIADHVRHYFDLLVDRLRGEESGQESASAT
jgi:AcrR family transcriptional regulator